MILKAALFIFLNKTCFNGLYRVNSKGLFNVPFNNAVNPTICDEENLIACSKALKNVELKVGDYKQCSSFIDENTFLYLDPPYRPLTISSSFTSYSKDGFDDLYKSFKISRINALRMINNNSKKRGAISELLISNTSVM